jgi:hypothetical protein
VDAAQNEAVYGPGRSPADILGGQPVPAPPVFGDLYDKLNEVRSCRLWYQVLLGMCRR